LGGVKKPISASEARETKESEEKITIGLRLNAFQKILKELEILESDKERLIVLLSAAFFYGEES
jgi:hypothetical protein